MIAWRLVWGCLLALTTAVVQAAPLRSELLDDLRQPALWQVSASDQVQASARPSAQGGVCLDYNFAGVSGYAVLRRALPVDWPARFDLTALISGQGAQNDLQLKLVDASGNNVWWLNRPAFALPAQPTPLRVRSRQISFAWGPGPDKQLRHTAFIELVISASQTPGGGGKGALCLSRLSLQERAPDPAVWPEARVRDDAKRPTLDFQTPREFNGVALAWPPSGKPQPFELQASDDGRQWRRLRRGKSQPGGLGALFLPDEQARWLRLSLAPGSARPTLSLRSAAQWPTANAVVAELATRAPRGDLPRAFVGQQNYWTVVGVDRGGARSALISEDGALEVGPGGYSVEPAVRLDDGSVVTWAGVSLQHSLREGYLPQPQVRWQHAAFGLDIDAGADGPPDAPSLLARYTLRNTSARPQTYTLLLATRPWQVNPPQQFLSTQGGISAVQRLRWDGQALQVNARGLLQPTTRPSTISALGFDGGLSLDSLLAAPALRALDDPQALASALMQFRVTLAPGQQQVLGWTAGLAATSAGQAALDDHALSARLDASAATWRQRLNRVTLQLPPSGQPVVDTLRSSLAHLLMSRDGAALRPGTRSYARTWIRDGAMMVAALLRLGEVDAAREFVDWYATQLFASGKVPCCVDGRGADPVVENDSAGEYLYAVAQVWRHTGDLAWLQTQWPHAERVTNYLEGLRQQERAEAARRPANARLFGLLPPSISHEGYSDKPAYAYWDNFWALRAYRDAVLMAQALGHAEQASAWAAQRDQFAQDLSRSLSATASATASTATGAQRVLAGAADRGDFDPTSSSVALDPAQAQDLIEPGLLQATFERYWRSAQARADGSAPWRDYTPYEWRNVGALLRLGHPERARGLMAFLFQHQRPAGWNQWAEVVLPDAREPHFLGDMPHAWVSSDAIRSLLDLLGYEREGATPGQGGLVIGAGWDPAWLAQGDIVLRGLSTAHGPLDYRLLRRPGGWTLHLDRAGAPVDLVWQGHEKRLPPAPSTTFLELKAD